MLYLWYFLFGYVIINVELLGVERLLNAAAKEGLQFLELRRKSYTQFRAKLSMRDYKKLQKMLPAQSLSAGRLCPPNLLGRLFSPVQIYFKIFTESLLDIFR